MNNIMELRDYISKEKQTYEGSLCFTKACLPELLFTKKLQTELLHPNPENDFLKPGIGPHWGIIKAYCSRFASTGKEIDPLIVEKMEGDAYLILDGHHRWAAAMMLGIEMLPVQIVNLTHDTDHKKMLEKSSNVKRVTFDFDRILCTTENDSETERTPKLLFCDFDKKYKEKLRSGVPALLKELQRRGYDVWIYTIELYSVEYIRWMYISEV